MKDSRDALFGAGDPHLMPGSVCLQIAEKRGDRSVDRNNGGRLCITEVAESAITSSVIAVQCICCRNTLIGYTPNEPEVRALAITVMLHFTKILIQVNSLVLCASVENDEHEHCKTSCLGIHCRRTGSIDLDINRGPSNFDFNTKHNIYQIAKSFLVHTGQMIVSGPIRYAMITVAMFKLRSLIVTPGKAWGFRHV